MSIRKDIAELRAAIPYLKRLAIPDVDNFALERVLNFTEEAIKVIEAAAESVIAPTYLQIAAKDLLAKLGEESR